MIVINSKVFLICKVSQEKCEKSKGKINKIKRSQERKEWKKESCNHMDLSFSYHFLLSFTFSLSISISFVVSLFDVRNIIASLSRQHHSSKVSKPSMASIETRNIHITNYTMKKKKKKKKIKHKTKNPKLKIN